MHYTHEHLEIQKTLKRFIDAEINPHVDEWEAAEIFPAHEVFKKLGDLGLLGLTKPEAFGGAGLDYSYAIAMAEALGHIECGGVPMAIGVLTDMCTPALARFGSDELRREFLAPAIAGDRVGCIGVSEPAAGSDVAGIKSVARKDGDDYVITGQKMWITNSLQADWMCMLVNTGEGPIHRNKSLVMVPMRDGRGGKLTKGIEVAQKIRKIGMNSSDTGLIYFDEVRVPQRYRIGAEGQGFVYQMQQFQEERLWAAASCLQSLTNCIQWTIEWAQERKLFGATLADQQWVQFKLAELKTEVESLRALTYRAGELYVQGQDVLEMEEDIGILRGAAQHRMFWRQGTRAVSADQFRRQHFCQYFVVDRNNLRHFMRSAETVEEMQHRDAPGQRRGRGDHRHIVRFLHRIGRQQREAGGARRHHVRMVAEDRQRMRCDGARGDVEDRRRQFAGNLVHVGNHQQEALRRRKGRRQRPRLQRAMHRAGGAAFGLQLDDLRHAAPDVGLALRRPFVGQFAHAGRGGDRIDRDHFGNPEGNRGDGFVAVDGEHLVHDDS